MRAQVVEQYGGPEVLTLQDVPEPQAGAGQLRVRVAYAGVNAIEWKLRSGAMAQVVPLPLPVILGNEVSGVVDQVGAGAGTFRVGDRVAGFVPGGGDAEYVLTTPDRLTAVPPGLSLRRAAIIPQAVETAERALPYIDPRPGETVVVNAAAGSVGSAVVQLLVARGVTVVGTASPDNHDYLRSLGAAPVQYGEGLLEQLQQVAPDGVDAAFDGGGNGFVDQMLTLLPAERIVTIADFSAQERGVRLATGDPLAITTKDVHPIMPLAARGGFITQIAAEFPLEDLAAAHRLSQAGHLRGKIVIRIAGSDD